MFELIMKISSVLLIIASLVLCIVHHQGFI